MPDQSQRVLKYIPSVTKALEVILWLANRQPGIDIYHLVKSTFYGDKYHVVVTGKSFDELLELTHRDAAYQRAVSGTIDYRDLIPDDDPQKREKVEYLEDVASIAVL
jgi:hypothetical protein